MEYVFIGVVLGFLLFILSSFRPAITSKIDENIFAVNCLMVNFYILKIGNDLILFDTGLNAVFAKRGFKKLGLSPLDVTHIFLTHSDGDHAGGVKAFSNAQLFLSTEEEQMINGKTAKKLFIHNKKLKDNYHLLENNDILEIDGVTIRCILTPGHTPGSMIYLIDNRICVTGDLLRITRRSKLVQFLRLMNMNHKQNMKSLNNALDILNDAEIILSGHTGIGKIEK